MKAVIFSDMLGSSKYVGEDFAAAIEQHEMFQTNMTFNIYEEELHPVAHYPENLRKFARDNSLTSFDNLLPMSDSVFVTTADANTAVVQWSHFLVALLMGTCNGGHPPAGEADPRVVEHTHLHASSQGITRTVENRRQYPLLLRSGISCEDYLLLNTNGIVDHNREGPIISAWCNIPHLKS